MPISPQEVVRQLSGAAYLARAFQTVAGLGIADALDETPTPVTILAQKLNLSGDALLRVLRLLAANGVFSVKGDVIAHSPASRLLRSDNPRSMRALPMMYGTQEFWAPLPDFEKSLRSGRGVFDGQPDHKLWAKLERNPESARIFDVAMEGRAHAQVAATVANYDFSNANVVGDIGGGRGHLAKAILEANPRARAVIFDLPHVVESISPFSETRLTLQGGDFFKDKLPVCDLYAVMDVIHDWGDKESIAILSRIRRFAPANAKLLLVERIMPDDDEPKYVKTIDIVMLALLGGKQRTMPEFETLFAASGWALNTVIDTNTGLSLIEADAR